MPLIALPGVSVTDSTVWKHSAAHTASLAPPLSHTHTQTRLAFHREEGVQGRRQAGAGTVAGGPVGRYGFVIGCRVV